MSHQVIQLRGRVKSAGFKADNFYQCRAVSPHILEGAVFEWAAGGSCGLTSLIGDYHLYVNDPLLATRSCQRRGGAIAIIGRQFDNRPLRVRQACSTARAGRLITINS